MLTDHVCNAIILRQICRDGFPGFTKIVCRIYVNLEVTVSMAIERNICSSLTRTRSYHAADVRTLWQIRDFIDYVLPGLAVAGDLQIAIVGSNP